MAHLFFDLETRSSVDLKKSNVYRYSESDDFEILMVAWAVDDGPVKVAVGTQEIADKFLSLFADKRHKLVAHNAQFERICMSRHLGLPTGTYIKPTRWIDTMARAAEAGHPLTLDGLAKALGTTVKDSAGTRLINLFCTPNRDGEFTAPEEKPEQWQQFIDYCKQDVAVLQEVFYKLPAETAKEAQAWRADQVLNDIGVEADLEMAEAAVEAAEVNQLSQELEVMRLTGVKNPGSLQQMRAWFEGQGVDVPDLKKETVDALLAGDSLTDDQRRVLELRQELALTASSKYLAVLRHASEDRRLRGQFRFFGAHTGRWAGRGVQLHNLPRAQLETVAEEDAARLDLAMGAGADAQTLKRLVRATLVGPFTVVDYSAIEARVVAWLAGEEWALEAFRDGRDIYIETAARMFNLDRKAAKARRFDGKVATLALGYNGGVGSLAAMGADGDRNHLQNLVNQWRRANRNIVELWAQMDKAFRVGGLVGAGQVSVETDGSSRYLRLPSGRAIAYHGFGQKWVTTQYGKQRRMTFLDPRKNNIRVDTYGGRLVENITQAVARDVLSEAVVRLQENGFRVVGHVHDEILVEGEESVEEVERIMCETTDWSAGLPLAAEGDQMKRYRKE